MPHGPTRSQPYFSSTPYSHSTPSNPARPSSPDPALGLPATSSWPPALALPAGAASGSGGPRMSGLAPCARGRGGKHRSYVFVLQRTPVQQKVHLELSCSNRRPQTTSALPRGSQTLLLLLGPQASMTFALPDCKADQQNPCYRYSHALVARVWAKSGWSTSAVAQAVAGRRCLCVYSACHAVYMHNTDPRPHLAA